MTLVDSRGRLFGVVNVLDVLAVLVVAGTIAGIVTLVASIRAARARPVEITGLSPTTLVSGQVARVALSGVEFPPDLKVYFVKAGQPFFLADRDGSQKASVLVSSPQLAEVQPPDLVPGTYDVYLYAGNRQLALRSAVVRVDRQTKPRGTCLTKVRFFVPRESAHLLKVGDQDQFTPARPTNPSTEGAIVRAVDRVPGEPEILEMHLIEKETRWIGQRMPRQVLDVTLQVPVLNYSPGAWVYREGAFSTGAIFPLTTDRYRFHGLILSVSEITPVADDAPPLK